jgi:hypothetical protein
VHDGARLREELIGPNNTTSDVWAHGTYRWAENKRFLAELGKVSRNHRRKIAGQADARNWTGGIQVSHCQRRARGEEPFLRKRRSLRPQDRVDALLSESTFGPAGGTVTP